MVYRKKKYINILTIFSIFHKSAIKLSYNCLLTMTLKAPIKMTLVLMAKYYVKTNFI